MSAQLAPFIPLDPSDPPPSREQSRIYEWFANGRGHLVVRARAGSGKTHTILRGINFAPEQQILLAAFAKRNQEDFERKLRHPLATALTLHSAGLRVVSKFWPRILIDKKGNRARSLTEQVCGADVPDAIKKLVTKLHSKGREIAPHAKAFGDLTDLAIKFDCEPDEDWLEYGYDLAWIERAALKAMHAATTRKPLDTGIDFPDMIFLPIRMRWLRPQYGLVVVDEAQDMNAAQLELAQGLCRGRLVLVGDDRQCQPAGTLVRVSKDAEIAIEQLVPGDTVVTFDRHGQSFIGSGVVAETGARNYRGSLFTVTAGGRTSRCTDSHKWLVRWWNRSENVWVTYLMRKGVRYRVGQCRLFRVAERGTNGLVSGISQRVRTERADAAWILRTHERFDEALAYEQIVATRYGLPEMCFQPPTNIKHFTQAVIDHVYTELGDLKDNAIRCLEEHGRELDYPFYVRNDEDRQGRQTLFVTQACNLIAHYMALPVAPDPIAGYDKRDRHAVEWHPLDVSSVPFEGEVYSLNVAKHHKYVADGLVTCNSIYGFRGADPGGLDRLKAELSAAELGLTVTYRCAQAIVRLAKELVPDYSAHPSNPEGEVATIELDALAGQAKGGEAVLSRLNAPLMSIAMAFIRKQQRVKVVGRDIAKRILDLIERLAKGKGKDSVPALLERLVSWEEREVTRAVAAGLDELEIEQIRDLAETVKALTDGVSGVPELKARVDNLFVDDGQGDANTVICSSVHKAKGLEWDTVYVLRETLGGKKRKEAKAPTAADVNEEMNIKYVSITRARTRLVWVDGLPV